MSSILRALKKLENQPGQANKTQPLDSTFVPLADTGPQKKPANILMVAIGGGLVCGLVVLAGWWLFSAKNQPMPVSPQQLPQQGIPQQKPAPAAPDKRAAAEHPAVAADPLKPAADTMIPLKTTVNPPEAAIQELPQPAPPPAVEQPAPEAADMQAVEPAAETPEIPRAEAAAPQVQAERAAQVSRPPEKSIQPKEIALPVLNDPGMKLQAITWSKDPQKRIAVINNRILRQGDVVSGYRIDTINQDDIVLSDGGKKWQLVFRIR